MNRRAPAPQPSDVLRGTLDLLILRSLALEPMHGWALSQHIQDTSRDALQVGQGSLYPALQRLEHRGWIASDWRTTGETRRARYYRLTASGRRELDRQIDGWHDYVRAVALVLAARRA